MRHDLQIHAVHRIRRPVLRGVYQGRMVPDYPLIHLIGTINGTPFHAHELTHTAQYNVLPVRRVPRSEYDAITRKMLNLRRSDDLPQTVIPYDESMCVTRPNYGDSFTDEGHERVRLAYVEAVNQLRAQHPQHEELPDWRGPNELTPEEYAKHFPHARRGG